MFEFTHTHQKEVEAKKEAPGPIAPPAHRPTTLFKTEAKEPNQEQEGGLFGKKSVDLKKEEKKDDDDYEEIKTARKGGHKGLFVHFESRCQTKMFIPTRLSELETNQIDVLVEDGLMQQKKSLLTTSHFLSFKVRIPQLKTEVRRQDEDFDALMKYLTQEYPHLIVPLIRPSKA